MSKLNCFLAIFLLAFGCSNVDSQTTTYSSTACEGFTLSLSCSPNYMLNIMYANFGRFAPGFIACPRFGRDLFTLCFSRNATVIMRNRCDERTNCTVPATTSVFGDPCRGTYKYLYVTYTCTLFARACENSSMTIQCPPGQTIRIFTANYGRTLTGSGACPASDFTTTLNTNCRAENSTLLVSNACNYNNTCTVPASSTLFGDPCPGTTKYLQATYSCS